MELGQIIQGNFQANELKVFIAVQALQWIVLMFIAWRFYIKKNKYSIMSCTISFLGSNTPDRNPKGWYFSAIADIILGLMDIPLFLYLKNKYLVISDWATWIATIFLIVRAIGMIMIAFLPDPGENFKEDTELGHIHNFVAIIAFASMALGLFILLLISLFGASVYSLSITIPPFLFIFILAGVGIHFQKAWANKCKGNPKLDEWPGVGIYSFPLWEWILFLTQYAAIYWLCIALV